MRIPHTPPDFHSLYRQAIESGRLEAVLEAAGTAEPTRYFHWDELRFRTPPKGLTHEEWWLATKLRRLALRREVPLRGKKGAPFHFATPDSVIELLHQIDRDGGTLIEIPEPVTNPAERDRYLMRSLMEEAITSSQLEGAATTRQVAKKMLAEGRSPRTRDERMIVNNFATMQRIMEIKAEKLTPSLVLDIHRRVAEGAIDRQDGAGRLRRGDEAIDVSNEITGQVFHVPPAAEELPTRLDLMCSFANGETAGPFVHPVLRAIILHFWLAYDHPFVDGNGRTARALFYWQMLHADYWLFEFISISQILRKAPVQYGTAFLHTETDGNDLTYFILHQADVIRRALLDLHDYVVKKSRETRTCAALIHARPDLNLRQQALLAHALRHPGYAYNIAGHRTRHGVVYQTARTDLLKLAKLDLLETGKSGNELLFYAPADLEQRLKNLRR